MEPEQVGFAIAFVVVVGIWGGALAWSVRISRQTGSRWAKAVAWSALLGFLGFAGSLALRATVEHWGTGPRLAATGLTLLTWALPATLAAWGAAALARRFNRALDRRP